MKIHSSCEIEYFVETHICKLCDTAIARITGCVFIKDIGRRLPLQLQCSYQGQQGDVSQSVPYVLFVTQPASCVSLTVYMLYAICYMLYKISLRSGLMRAQRMGVMQDESKQ